jgi:RNA polymerase sigma-70 factor (ECF subfamily)
MADRFEETFRRSHPRLVRLAWRVLRDQGEAEDVAQETLVRLADAAVLDRPAPEVDAWLTRVCLNRASNRLRGRARARERDDRSGRLEPRLTAEDPAVEVTHADERARVRAVLAELPDRQRAVLVLRHSGYAYREIAAAVEVAVGSVGTLLARAERAFRAAYDDARPDAEPADPADHAARPAATAVAAPTFRRHDEES